MNETIKTKDGKVYELTPLQMEDVFSIANLYRWRPWKKFLELNGTIPQDVFDAKSETLFASCQAKEVEPFSPEVQAFLETQEGQLLMFWLALKKSDSEITLDQATELFEDELMKKIEAMSSPAVKGAKGTTRKTTTKKKGRPKAKSTSTSQSVTSSSRGK